MTVHENMQDALEATYSGKCIACHKPADGKPGFSYCAECRDFAARAYAQHLRTRGIKTT